MQELRVDGVSFTVAVIRRMSEQEFVDHPMHEHHYRHLKAEDKKRLLRDIYHLINTEQA